MSLSRKIYVELCSPAKPENIPSYYDSFAHLLDKITGVSIASHPVPNGISGFERSSNLVAYLRLRAPARLKILFHITCNDVNKANLKERYDQIIKLQVDQLLGITGDPYECALNRSELYFSNSSDLIMAMNYEELARDQSHLLKWAIAAYPGSKNAKEEAFRSMTKIKRTKGNLIITQCLTEPEEFKLFVKEVINGDLDSSGIEIIPSVGIFDGLSNLNRMFQLTKIKKDQELVQQLINLEDNSKSRAFSLKYLVKLCQTLTMNNTDSIVLCAFNQFEMVEKLIDALDKG